MSNYVQYLNGSDVLNFSPLGSLWTLSKSPMHFLTEQIKIKKAYCIAIQD